MQRAITYSGFLVATLIMLATFLTAQNYLQLGIAVLLYPAIAYLALKLFPRRMPKAYQTMAEGPAKVIQKVESEETGAENTMVADVEKRAFLKVIGAAGISFILFSLFNRRADILFPNRTTGRSEPALPEPVRQPLEGYQISEIDDSAIAYYGFINKSAGWIIMREDTDNGSFRYSKGDSEFSNNWAKREQLKYDYFNSLY